MFVLTLYFSVGNIHFNFFTSVSITSFCILFLGKSKFCFFIETKKLTGHSDDLKAAAELVNHSTASLGKFQAKLSKKLEQGAKLKAKKRKFESNTGDSVQEKERNLGILESINNKKSKLDMNHAIGKKIHEEDTERSEEKKNRKPARGGKGKGGRKVGSSFSSSGMKGRGGGGGGRGGGAGKGGAKSRGGGGGGRGGRGSKK